MAIDPLYTEKWLPLYNAMYSERGYQYSFSYLNALILQHNNHARDVLELACGTGRYTSYFGSRYHVVATDISADAIAVARERARAEFLVMGMEQLNDKESYDVVVCLFEPFRYLGSNGTCELVLTKVFQALRKGGMFLCDFSIYPPGRKTGKPGQHKDVRVGNLLYVWEEYLHTEGKFDVREDLIKIYKTKMLGGPELIEEERLSRGKLLRISAEKMIGMMRAAGFKEARAVQGFPNPTGADPHSFLFIGIKK